MNENKDHSLFRLTVKPREVLDGLSLLPKNDQTHRLDRSVIVLLSSRMFLMSTGKHHLVLVCSLYFVKTERRLFSARLLYAVLA